MGSIRCPKCKIVSLIEKGSCPRCGYDFSRLKAEVAPLISRPIFGPPAIEPHVEPKRPRQPTIRTIKQSLAATLIRARHRLAVQTGSQEFLKSSIASLSTPHPLPKRASRPTRPSMPLLPSAKRQYPKAPGAVAFKHYDEAEFARPRADLRYTLQKMMDGAEAFSASAAAAGSVVLRALTSASANAWEFTKGLAAAAANALEAIWNKTVKAGRYIGRSIAAGAKFIAYILNIVLVALLVGFAKLKAAAQSLAERLKRGPIRLPHDLESFEVETIPMVPLKEVQISRPHRPKAELELPTIEPEELKPISLSELTKTVDAEIHLPVIQEVVAEATPVSKVSEYIEAIPAGIFSRALAGIIDILLIVAVVILFLIPAWLAGAFDSLTAAPSKFAAVTLSVYLFALATAGIYQTAATAVYGQTLGKRLLGIRVIDVSGEPLKLSEAIVRFSAWLISGLFFGLGWLWLVFDLNHRGLHDYLTQTVVIKDAAKV